MRESYIEKQSVKIATSYGWIQRKLQFVGQSGAPDRIFLRKSGVKAEILFVEFKAPGKKPRPEQDIQIQSLRKAGAMVHVVDNLSIAEILFR